MSAHRRSSMPRASIVTGHLIVLSMQLSGVAAFSAAPRILSYQSSLSSPLSVPSRVAVLLRSSPRRRHSLVMQQSPSDDDAEGCTKCISSTHGIVGGCADDKLAHIADDSAREALVFKTRATLLGVAALYGTNFGSIKIMQETIPPSTAALLRFTLALAALSPFLASTPKALWKPGIEIGLWVALGYIVQGVGLDQGSSASTAAFLCSLAVVLCPLLDFFDGVKISSKTWLAASLAVGGVAVLEITGGEAISRGDLFSLAQPIGFGMGFWKIEKVMKEFPGYGKELTAIQLVVVWCVGALWCTYDNAGLPDIDATTRALSSPIVAVSVLWTGFVTTALTVLLQTTSLGVLSSTETTVLYATEPVWAAAFASTVLGEQIGLNTVVGGAMILGACVSSSVPSQQWGRLQGSLVSMVTAFPGGAAALEALKIPQDNVP